MELRGFAVLMLMPLLVYMCVEPLAPWLAAPVCWLCAAVVLLYGYGLARVVGRRAVVASALVLALGFYALLIPLGGSTIVYMVLWLGAVVSAVASGVVVVPRGEEED